MDGYSHPDLQRILAGLNGTNSSDVVPREVNAATSAIPGLNLTQPETSPPLSHVQVARSARNVQTAPTAPDASTITTWPAALKYVTKYLTTNEQAAAKIKQLITRQHKHERQWWAGREAIVARHANRAGNQAKATDLLRAMGGHVNDVPTSSDPEVDRKEVEVYDEKVYTELTKMAADYDRQLRTLGVPFFAIKHELVILEQGGAMSDIRDRIDKGELRELQRRMLQTLEDLFMD